MTTTFKRGTGVNVGMGERRKGKVVYQPPEKAWTGIFIEETPHGLKVYKHRDSERHFLVIPWSKVAQIITED